MEGDRGDNDGWRHPRHSYLVVDGGDHGGEEAVLNGFVIPIDYHGCGGARVGGISGGA